MARKNTQTRRKTPAEKQADSLRDLVRERLALEPDEMIECPRQRSSMTPCIARDGALAVADDRVCVGCGCGTRELLEVEMEKHPELEPEL